MARTKGSKNGVRKPKQTSNNLVEPYKYRNGDKVIYIGGLWDKYKDCIGKVTRCYLEKRFYKWYKIEFEDEHVISVKEDWIVGVDEEISEQIDENKL